MKNNAPRPTKRELRVGIASGRHALKEAYGYDELELWQRQQVALGLEDELPATKIMPRRLGGNRHVEVDTGSDPHPTVAVSDVVGQPVGLGAQVAAHVAPGATVGAGSCEKAS